MNCGLISPNETKHHLKLDEPIHPNSAANNVIGLQVVY